MYFVTAVFLQTKGFFSYFQVHSFVPDRVVRSVNVEVCYHMVVLIYVPIDINLMKFFRQVFYDTDL